MEVVLIVGDYTQPAMFQNSLGAVLPPGSTGCRRALELESAVDDHVLELERPPDGRLGDLGGFRRAQPAAGRPFAGGAGG